MNTYLLRTLSICLFAGLFSMQVQAITPDPEPDPDPDPPSTCSNCYQRGPNPTVSALEADSGPYSVRTINVSSWVSGFGGGTIHYPVGTEGTMGAIAVIPGYVSYERSIKWWGPRLASWGFVVITTDTNTIYDQPDSRADQLSAALDYVISQSNSSRSPIYGMVDANRLGAMGWSMGGGGTLKLSTERELKAAIPQAPYYAGFNPFDEITTPTLIIACELDVVAPVAQHASPFYREIPGSTAKAFLEINGGDHFCANSGYPDEDILGKYGIAWMKRFIDEDRRYDQFLCGPNHEADRSISEYRDTCNY
ncbi:MAG: alpha/beta hydrolase [Pseudomonadales bacterium]|nr:alpha/beta hydrolase [Pseudomonadales bacterium]MAQ23205.1 alpha/beta hydrolase [Pseudomonadales bacterium]TNC87782.1 MAG: alpha/beta hydrolase [Alcanivorax sp.]HAG97255.1 alpha/beta hydrolase [Gammaproteobacteria bacterium]HBO91857.1 alpha/beta hydrolase [Gammaproteobacteria bacterium]|tara:strand:- start:1893 stop:2816 length:924 start_codon:yes stop_codon:yes gene_type:complete